MPYIKQEERKGLNPLIDKLVAKIETKGQLNYCIFKMLLGYLDFLGLSYDSLSSIHGIIADVCLEFYRRKVAPYEMEKIAENGDIK